MIDGLSKLILEYQDINPHRIFDVYQGYQRKLYHRLVSSGEEVHHSQDTRIIKQSYALTKRYIEIHKDSFQRTNRGDRYDV